MDCSPTTMSPGVCVCFRFESPRHARRPQSFGRRLLNNVYVFYRYHAHASFMPPPTLPVFAAWFHHRPAAARPPVRRCRRHRPMLRFGHAACFCLHLFEAVAWCSVRLQHHRSMLPLCILVSLCSTSDDTLHTRRRVTSSPRRSVFAARC